MSSPGRCCALVGAGSSALECYSFATLGLVVASFVAAGDYYEHYGAFAAPFFGLVASATVARVTAGDDETDGRTRSSRPVTTGIAVGVAVAAILLVAYGAELLRTTTPDQKLSSASMARIETDLSATRCTVTDNVSILIVSGRFTADRRSCPAVVDSFGTALALTDGNLGEVSTNAAVQRAWQTWLESADDLVLNEPDLVQAARADDWDRQVERYARTHFSLVDRTGVVSVYRRRPV